MSFPVPGHSLSLSRIDVYPKHDMVDVVRSPTKAIRLHNGTVRTEIVNVT